MTLPEQGAKVATGVIDAMRGQPVMLAVLLLNVIIFLAIFYAVQTNRTAQHEIMKVMLDQNAKAQELLSRCVVPRASGRSPLFVPNALLEPKGDRR